MAGPLVLSKLLAWLCELESSLHGGAQMLHRLHVEKNLPFSIAESPSSVPSRPRPYPFAAS